MSKFELQAWETVEEFPYDTFKEKEFRDRKIKLKKEISYACSETRIYNAVCRLWKF
jgi:hypothetical protein